jgi:hypothetical protein
MNSGNFFIIEMFVFFSSRDRIFILSLVVFLRCLVSFVDHFSCGVSSRRVGRLSFRFDQINLSVFLLPFPSVNPPPQQEPTSTLL